MGLPRWLLGLGLIGALSLATNVSFAEPAAEPSEFVWRWPRFRTSEYITTGVVGAAALGVFFFAGLRDEPCWTGGILFDDAVRDAVRIRSRDGTATVRRLSDVTAIGVLLLTLGVDSLAVPLLRGSSWPAKTRPRTSSAAWARRLRSGAGTRRRGSPPRGCRAHTTPTRRSTAAPWPMCSAARGRSRSARRPAPSASCATATTRATSSSASELESVPSRSRTAVRILTGFHPRFRFKRVPIAARRTR